MFAIPVSSSILKNTNPLAVPGRWRTITQPATFHPRAVAHAFQISRARHLQRIEPGPLMRHRVPANGNSRAAQVSIQPFIQSHRVER